VARESCVLLPGCCVQEERKRTTRRKREERKEKRKREKINLRKFSTLIFRGGGDKTKRQFKAFAKKIFFPKIRPNYN
jgi:hypothetical protein